MGSPVRMNLLIAPAPKTVQIAGVETPISWDFRTGIRFELLMEQDLTEEERLLQALVLYYPGIHFPDDQIQEAIEKLLWFYTAGKQQNPSQNGSGTGHADAIYSYEYDDEYLYAAFLEQYGVDLNDTPQLHWWKFKAMFASLRSDCRMMEIMGYRSIEISPKMSQEQQQFYRKMKRQFALPLPKSEQEKLNAIEQALLNGGDLSNLL